MRKVRVAAVVAYFKFCHVASIRHTHVRFGTGTVRRRRRRRRRDESTRLCHFLRRHILPSSIHRQRLFLCQCCCVLANTDRWSIELRIN